MQFKIPKDTPYLAWTRHAVGKMMSYGLSATKVKSILSRHDRAEQGIAENTVAVMKKVKPRRELRSSTGAGSEKRPQEIWVMYQEKEKQKVIIAAWRYPGVSKERIPLPEGIDNELKNTDDLVK